MPRLDAKNSKSKKLGVVLTFGLFLFFYFVFSGCSESNYTNINHNGCVLNIPKLKDNESPLVSIIILAHNQVDLTLIAIKSIIDNVQDVTYELIVVDDHSTDETSLIPEKVNNVKFYQTDGPQPWMYARANNFGVQKTHKNSSFIWFLNNDIKVMTRDSLSSMVNQMNLNEDIGVVGSTLITPGGVLQEAGSVIYQDGRTMGCGRGFYPESYSLNFPRFVDYCSGASLLVRKDIFLQAGQFNDDHFKMYYEDSHMQMMIRYNLSKKILYEPKSIIQHNQFASSSPQQGKLLQEKAVFKFRALWDRELKDNHFIHGINEVDRQFNLICGCVGGAKKRILWIDSGISDTSGAGIPRRNRIIRSLRDGNYFVTLYLELFETEYHLENNYNGYQLGVEYKIVDVNKHYLSSDPFNRREYLSTFMETRKNFYDVVVISRIENMRRYDYAIKTHFSGLHVIYDSESMTFFREADYDRIRNMPNTFVDLNTPYDSEYASKVKETELASLELASQSLLVAQYEIDAISKISPKLTTHLSVLGDYVESIVSLDEEDDQFKYRKCVLFFGGFNRATYYNGDSILFYVKRVMPLLDKLNISHCLNIGGSNIPNLIKELPDKYPNVHILGQIKKAELKKLFKKSFCLIAPHQYSSGISTKTLQALSHGLPAVVSDVVARGFEPYISETKNSGVLISRNEEEFSQNIKKLLENESFWKLQREGAKNFVTNHYARKEFDIRLFKLFDSTPNNSKCQRS